MRQVEQMFLEAAKNMFLDDPAILGITTKGKPKKEVSHTFNHQYEWIRNLFALKVADSTFFESITAAFSDIHSYKYLNDDSFDLAFRKRLISMAVPASEIEKAVEAKRDVIDEVKKENGLKDSDWCEGSAGYNPDLEGIRQVSQEFNTNRKREEPHSSGGPNPKS
jgi:hypothetical protein